MNRTLKAIEAISLIMTLLFIGCKKTDIDVRVTTYTPQEIMATSAVCGGDVILAQGLFLSEIGVCWSKEKNPTVDQAHLSTTVWDRPFVCTINGLEPDTRYHIRAYALRGLEYYYGEDKSFTTLESGGGDLGGTLSGLFSVSETQQVHFSQGNLQYNASTNTWRFAENQYDLLITPEDMTCVDDNGNKYVDVSLQYSSTSNNWIDLFGWGTSSYEHGAVCYQPWSTSGKNYQYTAYGSYPCNLFDQTGEADWGFNSISNGGNSINTWRTLTGTEWEYLFFTRSTPSGIRFVRAEVNGVNGVIILPDDWDANIYYFYGINSITNEGSFIANVISAARWKILEDSGAVFLPAAGGRERTKVMFIGYCGLYWSSSCDYFNPPYNAHCMVFKGYDNLLPQHPTVFINSGGFSYGSSVRLVRKAE